MTPVDFLINQIKNDQTKKALTEKEWLEIFEQAKQMEKQEIINAHLTGLIHPLETEATKQAEQYYNQTYNLKHSLQ